MNESIEKSLLSLVVIAYNQELFIREAVEAAFAQTYSPLEIIISDDCSDDKTFDIITEIYNSYFGPHQVRLNRNKVNLGIGEHVNFAVELARGDVVVMAAGDDVSLPDRCQRVMSEWVEHGRPSAMCSSTVLIDSNGKELSSGPFVDRVSMSEIRGGGHAFPLVTYQKDPFFSIVGCSAVWRKELWQVFGPLPGNLTNEDTALTFRACLLNGIYTVDQTLVKYRKHSKNIWNPCFDSHYNTFEIVVTRHQHEIRKAKALKFLAECMIVDLEKAKSLSLITEEVFAKLDAKLRWKLQSVGVGAEWWNLSFWSKIANWNRFEGRLVLKLIKLLPITPYLYLRCFLIKLASRGSISKRDDFQNSLGLLR